MVVLGHIKCEGLSLELRDPEFQAGGEKVYFIHLTYRVGFYRCCSPDSLCAVAGPEDDSSHPLQYHSLSTVCYQ